LYLQYFKFQTNFLKRSVLRKLLILPSFFKLAWRVTFGTSLCCDSR